MSDLPNDPQQQTAVGIVPELFVPEEAPEETVEASQTPATEPAQETQAPVSEAPVTAEERKPHNATQEFAHGQTGTWKDDGITLALPSNHNQETNEAILKAPNVSLVDTPEARKWASVLQDGMDKVMMQEAFLPTLADENADFRQAVQLNNVAMMGQAPRFKHAENENLKGERAIIRVMSHLGLGGLFQAPLWHTGLWVTLKPPTDSEIVELNRQMAIDKIQMGRASYGLAFSNMSSFQVNRLVDFAIDHIYDTTVKTDEIPTGSMKSIIDVRDYPSLLWGLACAMFPNGFQYRRACCNDPAKCNHITEETLNVSKLQWTNTLALTDWQKTHMSVRQSKTKDKASIIRYKEELKRAQDEAVTIVDGEVPTRFILTSPTIDDHTQAGHRWIGQITEIVERALTVDTSDNERNRFIMKHGRATAMRNFAHWVKAIEVGTNIIDDRETIESMLNVMSSDDDIRQRFLEETASYINKSTISIIGIPVFNCPSCGTEQTSEVKLPSHANIIPLDVLQVFFELLSQKHARLSAR